MSETKFYIGQPVQLVNSFLHDVRLVTGGAVDGFDLVLSDQDLVNYNEVIPAILPNTWIQWNGGTKPPCGPEQDVLILQPGDECAWLAMTKVVDWANVEWYMIIKAPEVIK